MFRSIVLGMGKLLALFYDFIASYGIAIILLTVTVRLLLFPLALKAATLAKKNRPMQRRLAKLQPELRRLREKYPGDKQKQLEEQQRLMKEQDISVLQSFSGCLPVLLQAPVLMAMYQVLSGCDKLVGGRLCRAERFIPDGSALYEAIRLVKANFLSMNLGLRPSKVLSEFGIATAWPYYVTILLMGATMYAQQKLTNKSMIQDPQAVAMMKVMRFMPFIFTIFAQNFPVGLALYWVASNVWTIGQQYTLNRFYGPHTDGEAKEIKTAGLDPSVTAQPTANGASKQVGKSPNGVPIKGPAGQRKGSGARKSKKKRRR